MSAATCDHTFPGQQQGWGCPFRRCLNEADAAYRAALRAAYEAEIKPDPRGALLAELRRAWQDRPEQRPLFEAFAAYIESREAA